MKRIAQTAGAALTLALLTSTAMAADINCSASGISATQRLNCEQIYSNRTEAYVVGAPTYYYVDRTNSDRYYQNMADTRSSTYDTTGTMVNKERATDRYNRNQRPGEARSNPGSETAYTAPTKYGTSIGDKSRFSDNGADSRYDNNRYDSRYDARYDDSYVAPAAGVATYGTTSYGSRYNNAYVGTTARVGDDRYYSNDTRSSAYDTTGSSINKDAAREAYYRNDRPGESRSNRGSETAYTAPTKWGTSVADKDVYDDNNRSNYPSYSRRDYRYYNGSY